MVKKSIRGIVKTGIYGAVVDGLPDDTIVVFKKDDRLEISEKVARVSGKHFHTGSTELTCPNGDNIYLSDYEITRIDKLIFEHSPQYKSFAAQFSESVS